jgi:DeoR/GlpR family transcriptional regulator of sugar metabolism
MFGKVNVQKAFLGAAGFTLDSGLSDATAEEAQIKRFMAEAAREVIGIVDSSKWGRDAFATFCRTDGLAAMVTDDLAPELMVAALQASGAAVHIVGSSDPASPVERSAR